MSESASEILVDGSTSFEGGVDSGKNSSVVSASNPLGLQRNQLSWRDNATVRGGGILQRTGWTKLCSVADASALYQGGEMYQPDAANPFLILSIGGQIYQVRVDTDNSVI